MSDATARPLTLVGLSVMIVEDHFLIADEMCMALRELGATVLGPAASVSAALALLDEHRPDAAVLDVDLQGERVWPVAERLRERGVPFAFTTGYDADVVSRSFNDAARLEKPVRMGMLASTLERLVADR